MKAVQLKQHWQFGPSVQPMVVSLSGSEIPPPVVCMWFRTCTYQQTHLVAVEEGAQSEDEEDEEEEGVKLPSTPGK